MADKTVKAQNDLAKATELYEKAEEEKEMLMVGNEEKTEKILGETNEHGQILMTINSLYLVIMQYSDANPKHFFKPASIPELPPHFNVIKQNEKAAINQLGVISEVITNFQKFVSALSEKSNEPVNKPEFEGQ